MRTDQRGRLRTGSPTVEPVDGAMLRAIGAMTLVGIGAMHFLQIAPTFEATPLLGVAYVMFIAASVLVASTLVTRGDARTWAAAGVVCVAALAGYAFTRVLSTPFDNQDVGNWSCMLGLAALFVEGLTLALSAYVLALGAEARQPVAVPLAVRRRPAGNVADRQAG